MRSLSMPFMITPWTLRPVRRMASVDTAGVTTIEFKVEDGGAKLGDTV